MSDRLPQIAGRDMVRALQKAGFVIVRVSGSHYRLVHPSDASRATTIPLHGGKSLKRGTLQSILRKARITADEVVDLL